MMVGQHERLAAATAAS